MDWVHWRAIDEATEPGLDMYEDTIEALDERAFTQAVARHDVLAVDIDYPWCNKCK